MARKSLKTTLCLLYICYVSGVLHSHSMVLYLQHYLRTNRNKVKSPRGTAIPSCSPHIWRVGGLGDHIADDRTKNPGIDSWQVKVFPVVCGA